MMLKKISDTLCLSIFLLLLSAFLLAFLFTPAKSFSEIENRALAQAPRLQISSLVKGSFMEDFEQYLTDQFPLRDLWMDLKARCEQCLLKKEFNDVYLCRDGSLIKRYDAPSMSLVQRNIQAINTLAENTAAEVWLCLVPSSSCIYADKLPPHAPNYDQSHLIEEIYAMAEVPTIDVLSVLKTHREEYIYYKTDHHWTTLGAWYGYATVMEAMGEPVKDLSLFKARVVSEAFYGTVYSSSGVHWIKPDTITTYVEAPEVEITNYSSGSGEPGRLYAPEYLEHKDKYSYFYGGNTPLVIARSNNTEGKNILILRDSFMDSESPFLLDQFCSVHIMDLRYYRLSVLEYIEANDIDLVLVAYNVSNFAEDSSIQLAAS